MKSIHVTFMFKVAILEHPEYLIIIPPEPDTLFVEVFSACPNGGRPWGRPRRLRMGLHIPSGLGIPQQGLEDVVRKWDVCVSLFSLLPPQS